MKNALDLFGQIFCINLKRRTERWEAVSKEFEKLGIADRVIKFEGIDNPTQPTVGCKDSHCKIYEYAKENNYENVLIFEDDFELANEWEDTIPKAMEQLPEDWDMLYFGCNLIDYSNLASPNLIIPRAAKALHAYAIKSTLYDFLIKGLKNFKQPIDRYTDWYVTQARKFDVYAMYPIAAIQATGISDIEKHEVSYGQMMERNYKMFVKGDNG